jgi:hypothetical protein
MLVVPMLCSAYVVSTNVVNPSGAAVVRMSSTMLPDMYRSRWAQDDSHLTTTPEKSLETHYSAAKYCGALLGASAVAAIGVGASTMSTDYSLSLLGAAGIFNEHVLFTDLLMRWLDAANVAGCATLPLAVLYLMQASPDDFLATANRDAKVMAEDAEACLVTWETVGEAVESVCGAVSFDSTDDGMMCVEDYSTGSLKWVCA